MFRDQDIETDEFDSINHSLCSDEKEANFKTNVDKTKGMEAFNSAVDSVISFLFPKYRYHQS